jgi:hypothetical protein
MSSPKESFGPLDFAFKNGNTFHAKAQSFFAKHATKNAFWAFFHLRKISEYKRETFLFPAKSKGLLRRRGGAQARFSGKTYSQIFEVRNIKHFFKLIKHAKKKAYRAFLICGKSASISGSIF